MILMKCSDREPNCLGTELRNFRQERVLGYQWSKFQIILKRIHN